MQCFGCYMSINILWRKGQCSSFMSYYVNKSHLQLDPGNTRINFLIKYNLKKKKSHACTLFKHITFTPSSHLQKSRHKLKLSRWSPNVCFEKNLLLCIPSPSFDEGTEFVMEWCDAWFKYHCYVFCMAQLQALLLQNSFLIELSGYLFAVVFSSICFFLLWLWLWFHVFKYNNVLF